MAYCPKCGTYIDDDDPFCRQCGTPQNEPGGPAQEAPYRFTRPPELHQAYQDVPDHLGYAIVVTICCCLPLGIPAIVFAAMANSAKAAGNYQQAAEHAETANKWVIAAFASGIILLLISLLGSFGGL